MVQKTIKCWNVNVDNTVISKLIKMKNDSKYFIACLDDIIRLLVLRLPKISGHVKTFEDKDEDKDKNECDKLMSLGIDDDKLLEKCKISWTKIEDFQNIELNALPVYDDKYIKIKIRTYGDKAYTKCFGVNVPGDGVECESLPIFLLIFYLIMKENIVYRYI